MPSSKTNPNLITTKLESQKDSLAVISAIINHDLVATHRQQSIKHMAESLDLKGFRPGKVPVDVAQKHLDPQKITSHTLDHLLPEVLKQVLKNHPLKIIANPHLTKLETPSDQDWSVELTFPLLPEFELGEYQKIVKETKKTTSIWTPEKGKDETKPEDTQQEILSKILDALVKNIKITIPRPLIDEEVNHSLTRLLDQTQNLGVTVQDYLKSLGKTSDQLKKEYEQSAEEGLKLEFILNRIAQDLHITVSEKEIDDMIQAAGDDTVRQKLNTPDQRSYIKNIINRRKTIDALLEL